MTGSKEKLALPKEMHQLYDAAKSLFTAEAFAVWYQNALTLKDVPVAERESVKLQTMPSSSLKQKAESDVVLAAQKARQAVSGMSATNNTRKAVEALADAVEKISV